MSSYFRQRLEEWLKTKDVSSKNLLDIGGSQNPLKGRTKSWDVKLYHILDLADPHQGEKPDIECDLNLNGACVECASHQLENTFEDYGLYIDGEEDIEMTPISRTLTRELVDSFDEPSYKYPQSLKEFYDTAFCLEVMEYVYNPLQVLKNIAHFLKPDGKLYISFPFLYPIHPPSGTDYLRYTKYGAEKLLVEAGFEIVEHIPRKAKHKGHLIDFYRKDGYRYDRSENYDTLAETGSLIIAKKK